MQILPAYICHSLSTYLIRHGKAFTNHIGWHDEYYFYNIDASRKDNGRLKLEQLEIFFTNEWIIES